MTTPQIVTAAAIRSGDQIEVPQPGGQLVAARVVEVSAGGPDGRYLDWSSLDGQDSGRLVYQPGEMVTRLHANGTVAA